MFRTKKNKPNKASIDIHKDIFYEYQKYDSEDKKLVKSLYNEIKTDYEKLLRYGLLDIHLERIRINKCLSKYNDTSNKRKELNKAIVLICISGLLNMVTTVLFKSFESYGVGGILITVILYVSFIIYISHDLKKDDKRYRSNEKDLVNNISLIVLDDMEKSINEDVKDEIVIGKDIKHKEIEFPEESKIKNN